MIGVGRTVGIAIRLGLVGLIAGCSASASATTAGPSGAGVPARPIVAGYVPAAAAAPRFDSAAEPAPDVAAVTAAAPRADIYAQYAASAAPVSSPRRFVVLGDSLSAWVFASGCTQPSTTGAWPWILAARDSSLTMVYSAAVPGNSTGQMLARMDRDVFAYEPDVLFILGGTNDVAYGVSDSTVVDNIRQMIKAARARGIEVVLLSVPPNNSVYLSKMYHYRDISESLQLLGAVEGVPVVDVYGALATQDGGLSREFEAYDDLHLNNAGEQAIADAVYSVLHPAAPPAHD